MTLNLRNAIIKKNGFSIIELLAVVFIIGVLSSIVVFNYQQARSQLALNRAAHQLVQDIRFAQELAMSSKELKEAEGTCYLPMHFASIGDPVPLVPTSKIPKGYGIYININGGSGSDVSYIMYADTSGGSNPDDWNFYTSADCVVRTIWIQETGVVIKSINTSNKKVSINFTPPNPNINIKWLADNQDAIEITLGLKNDSSKTKIVSVNRAGLIEIK